LNLENFIFNISSTLLLQAAKPQAARQVRRDLPERQLANKTWSKSDVVHLNRDDPQEGQ